MGKEEYYTYAALNPTMRMSYFPNRKDGPAVECVNGEKEYWYKDKHYPNIKTNEKWLQIIHSIKELYDIMPGEWKNYLTANEQYALLSGSSAYIYYFYDGYQDPNNKWWVFTTTTSGKFISTNQALNVYKKHFKLANFK